MTLVKGAATPKLGTLASESNGITFDCRVTRETGEDPMAVARTFGSLRRIDHVRFRNVVMRQPYENYAEVRIDEGQVDMFGMMREPASA